MIPQEAAALDLLEQHVRSVVQNLDEQELQHALDIVNTSLAEFVTPHLRRQVLRWMIAQGTPLTEDGIDVVRNALHDDDWETRSSALFVAGRLGLTQLYHDVANSPIAWGAAFGLDRHDIELLTAIREIVAAQLRGELAPSKIQETLKKMPAIPESFVRAVIGEPSQEETREMLWVDTLSSPAQTLEHPPHTLPSGVLRRDQAYFLRDTDIELVWVAPGQYWLGDNEMALPSANPIRHVTLRRGFFIGRYPIMSCPTHYAPPDPPTGHTRPVRPQIRLETYDDARAVCDTLSDQSGIPVTLPLADEWEMAARGTDGRRYPTGNGLEREMLLQQSPWGLYYAVGIVEQWTNTRNEHGQLVTCGKWRVPRCAARVAANPLQRAAIRPVVHVE